MCKARRASFRGDLAAKCKIFHTACREGIRGALRHLRFFFLVEPK